MSKKQKPIILSEEEIYQLNKDKKIKEEFNVLDDEISKNLSLGNEEIQLKFLHKNDNENLKKYLSYSNENVQLYILNEEKENFEKYFQYTSDSFQKNLLIEQEEKFLKFASDKIQNIIVNSNENDSLEKYLKYTSDNTILSNLYKLSKEKQSEFLNSEDNIKKFLKNTTIQEEFFKEEENIFKYLKYSAYYLQQNILKNDKEKKYLKYASNEIQTTFLNSDGEKSVKKYLKNLNLETQEVFFKNKKTLDKYINYASEEMIQKKLNSLTEKKQKEILKSENEESVKKYLQYSSNKIQKEFLNENQEKYLPFVEKSLKEEIVNKILSPHIEDKKEIFPEETIINDISVFEEDTQELKLSYISDNDEKNKDFKMDIFRELISNEKPENITYLMSLYVSDTTSEKLDSLKIITKPELNYYHDIRTLTILNSLDSLSEKDEIYRKYINIKLQLEEQIKQNNVNILTEEKLKEKNTKNLILSNIKNYKKSVNLDEDNVIKEKSLNLEYKKSIYKNNIKKLYENENNIIEIDGRKLSLDGINHDQIGIAMDALSILESKTKNDEQDRKKELVIINTILPKLTLFGNNDNITNDPNSFRTYFYERVQKLYEDLDVVHKNDITSDLINRKLNKEKIFEKSPEEQELFAYVSMRGKEEVVFYGTRDEINNKIIKEKNRDSIRDLSKANELSMIILPDPDDNRKGLDTIKLFDQELNKHPLIIPLFKNDFFDVLNKNDVINGVSKKELTSFYSFITELELSVLNGSSKSDEEYEFLKQKMSEISNFYEKEGKEELNLMKLKIKEDKNKQKIEIEYNDQENKKNENGRKYDGAIFENEKSKLFNKIKYSLSDTSEKIRNNRKNFDPFILEKNFENFNNQLGEYSKLVETDLSDDDKVKKSILTKMSDFKNKLNDIKEEEDKIELFNSYFVKEEFNKMMEEQTKNYYQQLRNFKNEKFKHFETLMQPGELNKASSDYSMVIITGGLNLLIPLMKDLKTVFISSLQYNAAKNTLDEQIKIAENNLKDNLVKNLVDTMNIDEKFAKNIVQNIDIQGNKSIFRNYGQFNMKIDNETELLNIFKSYIIENQDFITQENLPNPLKGDEFNEYNNLIKEQKENLQKFTKNKFNNELGEIFSNLKEDQENDTNLIQKQKLKDIIYEEYTKIFSNMKNNNEENSVKLTSEVIKSLGQNSEIQKLINNDETGIYKNMIEDIQKHERYLNFDKELETKKINSIGTKLFKECLNNINNDLNKIQGQGLNASDKKNLIEKLELVVNDFKFIGETNINDLNKKITEKTSEILKEFYESKKENFKDKEVLSENITKIINNLNINEDINLEKVLKDINFDFTLSEKNMKIKNLIKKNMEEMEERSLTTKQKTTSYSSIFKDYNLRYGLLDDAKSKIEGISKQREELKNKRNIDTKKTELKKTYKKPQQDQLEI